MIIMRERERERLMIDTIVVAGNNDVIDNGNAREQKSCVSLSGSNIIVLLCSGKVGNRITDFMEAFT